MSPAGDLLMNMVTLGAAAGSFPPELLWLEEVLPELPEELLCAPSEQLVMDTNMTRHMRMVTVLLK